MSRPRLLVSLALPLLLAACGGSAATPTPVPPTAAPSLAGTAEPSSAPSVAPASALPASAAPSLAAGPTTVTVAIVDYAFQPADITVPAGEVTFALRNDAGQEHEFEIFKGDQVVDEAEGLIPGLERDLVVTLAVGEYTYVCKLADHEQRGLKGTLTVTPG